MLNKNVKLIYYLENKNFKLTAESLEHSSNG